MYVHSSFTAVTNMENQCSMRKRMNVRVSNVAVNRNSNGFIAEAQVCVRHTSLCTCCIAMDGSFWCDSSGSVDELKCPSTTTLRAFPDP